jgi:hypothetical protein
VFQGPEVNMKKMVLVSMAVILLFSSGWAQEKEKRGGQFGLYFESSAISYFSLSGISLNIGQNAGKNFRIELAGTYYPLLGEHVGGTMIGFSLAGLARVTPHSRLNILVGPGFKMVGVLAGRGENDWTPSLLLKGLVEYRISDKWGMRGGFTQSMLFPSDRYESDYIYMTSGVEWGFFWLF